METTGSPVCNDTVKNIWLLCVKKKILITAAHIPRAENVIADYKSRKKIQRYRVDAKPCNISKDNKAHET